MSSATFCTSAPSSNCNTLTLMPVSSLKPSRFAAIAEVGEVFSETKLSVVPAYCFHMSAPDGPEEADPPPQPAAPNSEAPARPAPAILRKPLRETFLRIRNPLPWFDATTGIGGSVSQRNGVRKRPFRRGAGRQSSLSYPEETPAIPDAFCEHRDWNAACQLWHKQGSRCAGGERGCTLSVCGQGLDGPEDWDLDATQATLDVIRQMAAAMEENRRQLTKLDSEIGDGDHGNNMHRGFQAALERLEGADPSTPADVLKGVSMALISKVGGAAGPLYGTAFLRASSALGDKEEVSAEDAAEALEAALGGIKQRGRAEVGDKTIVDALEPAVEAAKEAAGEGSVAGVFRSAADAAKEGAESTVPLTAKRGRASYLGARAAGHQDPGATSTYMLLDAAARTLGGTS